MRSLAAAAAFVLVAAGSGCVSLNYDDRSDPARRKQILGHWYDQYMQGTNYAMGDTWYRADGSFATTYESVAPGAAPEDPARKETTRWSGKWHVQGGLLVEEITATSDASRTPADRPLVRSISQIDAVKMVLRSEAGNVNAYARKRPSPPKVTFTPGG